MKIPESKTTISAIYQHYEDHAEDGFRPHLGASIIGKDCARALWYDFHWCTPASFNGRMLRLFETGQMAEDRFVANLRNAGVTIFETDPQTRQQFRVQACAGHFGGSLDGIGQGFVEAPKAWHVVEMKTHSEKSFKDLQKKGVQEAKPQHFAQMQIYMHLTSTSDGPMKRAYYIAVNKNTDELYGERVKYDKDAATRLIHKAAQIIASDTPLPKLNEDPTWYQCKFCDHRNTCHGQQAPAVNCRTCLHSTPVDNGQWHCARYDCPVPEANQRKGCASHLYIPHLLYSFADVMDSGEYWVRYKLKSTGQEFVTGESPDQLSSQEIHATESKDILADPAVQAIRSEFQGRLVG
ncbi:PD-(D/E)XK nuclease family protein [Sansalvadorimonas verongulae]|uniref:PD-(D/E)XK nuclease family protein n=1 Tax=Sansalvadorimonas verongulae TaxID=2172824 RepID=UPI0012BCAA68|nr:PD-(D/E)XK nuclease family protein [Sansalvadorimonas verongulae]MTI13813.1 oxidoreductase [Sansalvadorimonas verongulae]